MNSRDNLSFIKDLLLLTDVPSICRRLVEEIGHAFEVDRVAILFDLPTPFLTQWSKDEMPQDDESLALLLRSSLGYCKEHEIQVCFSDEDALEAALSFNEQKIKLNAKSYVCIPIASEGLVAGVCVIFFAGDSRPEISWIKEYVDVGSIAIGNVTKSLRVANHLQQVESLLDARDAPLVLFNQEGSISYVSKAFAAMIPSDPIEIQGISYREFVSRFVGSKTAIDVESQLRESFQLKNSTKSFQLTLAGDEAQKCFDAVVHVIAGTAVPLFALLLSPVAKSEVSSFKDSGYERFVEHADAIVLRVDDQHNISYISKRSIDFFGVAPEDFVTRERVSWIDLVHPEDRARIRDHVREVGDAPRTFDEEFRIVNHITGRVRWLLLRFVPVFDSNDLVTAWEGFGFDVTQRKDAQNALDQQNKRIRALFTVSAAISGFIDPANISSRGLAALGDATNADAALCYLYLNKDEKHLSLVSHNGFSPTFADKSERSRSLPSLSQYVAESGHPVVVPDLRNDSRASSILFEEENMRSALYVPIQVEDDILGVVSLFSREVSAFDGGDIMLVNAAASQIGLAARQAQLFTAYRNQTKSLAALYRMSRELTRNLSLEEIFQNAFSIIRDEMGLTRLWLGMLNETGSRLIGQAAYGPGWKRRLIEMNVELGGENNPIARVVASRTPLYIKNPAQALEGFGFRKFFSTLEIHAIVFVPIMADMQVIGVLAVQPSQEEEAFDHERMTLLSSLADEIANVVLTKRLEERVTEGDKMRAAGLLAAGIAHNFNNLLQAILGQASLIDMQKADPPAVSRSAKTIIEAASKGSSLVKQLLSFAHLEYPSPELVNVNLLIERNVTKFSRILKNGQQIHLDLKSEIPQGYVDSQQLVRIISSIVRNAGESMKENGSIDIFSDVITITHSNPHFEVPYGTYVRIGIRDSGAGMDAETKRRCFEPFFTTKDRDPSSGLSMTGAGLGLASAYALARRNGGRLVVDSRPGYGSLFTIYLPVEAKESEGESVEIEQAKQSISRGSIPAMQVEKLKNIRVDDGEDLRDESSANFGRGNK